jgi:hypothetical protein
MAKRNKSKTPKRRSIVAVAARSRSGDLVRVGYSTWEDGFYVRKSTIGLVLAKNNKEWPGLLLLKSGSHEWWAQSRICEKVSK